MLKGILVSYKSIDPILLCFEISTKNFDKEK
jgi:hypothetical protein